MNDAVPVRRAAVVGRGHEASALPRGETFAFVLRSGAGAYDAFTDSYWAFAISDGARVHMPVRDPFTRAYVLFDDLAELVRLMRDRSQSPETYLARQCARLGQTPVAATQPIEVNDQLLALESLAHLGTEAYARAALPLLDSPHFQIRWSAVRATATCRGATATRALLGLLARETVPPVQAALAEALAPLADTSMRGELQAALPRMYASTLPYSQNVMSPIMNLMPCPRDLLAATIARISAAHAPAPQPAPAAPAMPAQAAPATPAQAAPATPAQAAPATPAQAAPAPPAQVPAARLRAIAGAKDVLALCESTPQGAVPLIEDGQLVVLSSRDHVAALEGACAGLFGTRKLTLQPIEDGVGIFANFPPAVTSIRLDPGMPSEETFSGTGLEALHGMARSIAVSRAVESPSTYDAASFGRIMRDHRRFVVPLQPMAITAAQGPTVKCLSAEIIDGRAVPYEILRHQRADGTHYAVAFTWDDCAEAFFAALGDRTRTVTIDGESLFDELRRIEQAYGATSVVFDMEGPTKQSWLKIGAWKLVLG